MIVTDSMVEEFLEANPPDEDLVFAFASVAEYHQIDLGDVDPGFAFARGAIELGLSGYQLEDDDRPANDYAAHNVIVRSLGSYVQVAALDVPAGALCGCPSRGGVCGRIRIPGYGACHWHLHLELEQRPADDEILSALLTEIGVA